MDWSLLGAEGRSGAGRVVKGGATALGGGDGVGWAGVGGDL